MLPRPSFIAPAGTVVAVAAVVLNDLQVASVAVLVGFVVYLPCARLARDVRPVVADFDRRA